jgi:hypothetical protein
LAGPLIKTRRNAKCRNAIKGSDPNSANLRANLLKISSLWLSCIAKPRGCSTLRERYRAGTARRAARRSSFLPRKDLIGMDKRLKLAPFGSDPFMPRGFPTQDGHKLLILRTSVLKLAPFGSDPLMPYGRQKTRSQKWERVLRRALPVSGQALSGERGSDRVDGHDDGVTQN